MKWRRGWFARLGLGATLLLGGACAGAPRAAPGVRVEVAFREPEKFSDVETGPGTDTARDAVLAELREQVRRVAAPRLPAGSTLVVTVIDLDLAGERESWRGPPWDETRLVRPMYPPRIVLEFRLTDAGGAVLREGRRDLGDLNFQNRAASPGEGELRYEKELLGDWVRGEFRLKP